jgi:hypothetical protein
MQNIAGSGALTTTVTLAAMQASCGTVELFDGSGNCQPEGITCLIGVPATAAHLSLCNLTVTNASSTEVGEQLAVASLMAAAYTCE